MTPSNLRWLMIKTKIQSVEREAEYWRKVAEDLTVKNRQQKDEIENYKKQM